MSLILETDAVTEMAIVRILGSPQIIGLGQSFNFLNKIIGPMSQASEWQNALISLETFKKIK